MNDLNKSEYIRYEVDEAKKGHSERLLQKHLLKSSKDFWLEWMAAAWCLDHPLLRKLPFALLVDVNTKRRARFPEGCVLLQS